MEDNRDVKAEVTIYNTHVDILSLRIISKTIISARILSIIVYVVFTTVNDLCLYIDLIYGHLCMITKDNLGKIKTLFVCVPGDFMPSKHLRILLTSPICY